MATLKMAVYIAQCSVYHYKNTGLMALGADFEYKSPLVVDEKVNVHIAEH